MKLTIVLLGRALADSRILCRMRASEGGKVVAPATKGGMPEWYMKYMTLCFSPQIPCFPLRGNAT